MRWQDTSGGIETIQFTMAMLAVCIAVFGAELTQRDLAFLSAYPWRIAAGEPWRLITSTVLHGSIFHIAFNMVWFFRFSSAIERWLGPWVAMGMYIFFAAGAGAAEMLWSATLAIGASGAVYGLFGFLWVTRRRYDIAAEVTHPHTIQMMLGWLVVCFVLNLFGSNIANMAHLFGLLFGWLVGQIVIARKGLRWPLVGATVILWVGLLSLTYGPVWQRTVAKVPYLNRKSDWISLPRELWPAAEHHPIGPGLYR